MAFAQIIVAGKQVLFNSAQQRAFLEDLLSLMRDGIALNQAIDVMIDVSAGLKKEVACSMGQAIASGQGIALGMQGWFLPIYLELMRAGEQSGMIVDALAACGSSMNSAGASIRACVAALSYPLLVLFAALGVIVFVKSSVLESFAAIRPTDQWPAVSQNLYMLASVLQVGWWLGIVLLVLLSVVVVYALRHLTGRARLLLDNLPLFNLYRQLSAARFMETLGLLLTNGVMLKNALVILQMKSHHYLNWHLSKMEMQLAHGQLNVAEVLDTDLLDTSDMHRLRILATGTGFAGALGRLGKESREKKMRALVRLANWVGGILLVGGAAAAMLMVLGIYSVSQVLGS